VKTTSLLTINCTLFRLDCIIAGLGWVGVVCRPTHPNDSSINY